MTQRYILPGLVLLAVFAALTAGLSAHLAVVKTLPAGGATISEPPERIEVWFTEPPSPRISRLEVAGPGGDVPLGELAVDGEERSIAAAVAGTLAPGSYTVTWRTAGNDGHVMRDTFTFSVEPTE